MRGCRWIRWVAAGCAAAIAPLLQASPCRQLGRLATGHSVVDHYFYDEALRRSWAVVVDCEHPERPWKVVEAPPDSPPEASNRMSTASPREVIRAKLKSASIVAGSRVELWRDGIASIHLSGVATESAMVGQPIRVRAEAGGNILLGRVRGPHSVELTAPSLANGREP